MDDVQHFQEVMGGLLRVTSASRRVVGLMAKELSKVSLSLSKDRAWY